jgi:60 kDa SS-A/Ro ribonucleoprotein
MANKQLFKNKKNVIKATNTVNNAGGCSYSMNDKNELAQLVVTGFFGNTFYVSADKQLERVTHLCDSCESEFVAACAVYSRRYGRMKDMPALLLAKLVARGERELVEKIFNRVVTDQKMLRNFVQIVRSGVTGRKSFGSHTKRLIQNWLKNQNSNSLFRGAVGNDPSLADVVKMVHPKPESQEKQAFYSWLLDKKYDESALPAQVKLFESFKRRETDEIPEVDFRVLTNFLDKEAWKKLALKMPWNALRMNINTLVRNEVFNDSKVLSHVNQKLQDKNEVLKNNAFPFQILTTSKAIRVSGAPAGIYLALEQAMEHATQNVPDFKGKKVAVCVDTSGSMSSPVTGDRTVTSNTSCIEAASLMACCVLRKNNEAHIIPFDTRVHESNLNPHDSVLTNAHKLAKFGGGGTDCASALRYMNKERIKADVVIFVSDNESWYGSSNGYRDKTPMAKEWDIFKQSNPKAKLVCIDISPNDTTQVPNLPSEILNVGGFSDSVFEIVGNFVNNDNRDFAQVIQDSFRVDKE